MAGVEQLVQDSASIADLGLADVSRTDLLCESDLTVAELAAFFRKLKVKSNAFYSMGITREDLVYDVGRHVDERHPHRDAP